jgi:hypothetical protein
MISNVWLVDEVSNFKQHHIHSMELNAFERHLLNEIKLQAQKIAPDVGKALIARINELNMDLNLLQLTINDLQSYFQVWFLQLFPCRNDACLDLSAPNLMLNHTIVCSGLDIILTYGFRITQYSSHPVKTNFAFYKSLAQKLAQEQFQFQTDSNQYHYEMILLD